MQSKLMAKSSHVDWGVHEALITRQILPLSRRLHIDYTPSRGFWACVTSADLRLFNNKARCQTIDFRFSYFYLWVCYHSTTSATALNLNCSCRFSNIFSCLKIRGTGMYACTHTMPELSTERKVSQTQKYPNREKKFVNTSSDDEEEGRFFQFSLPWLSLCTAVFIFVPSFVPYLGVVVGSVWWCLRLQTTNSLLFLWAFFWVSNILLFASLPPIRIHRSFLRCLNFQTSNILSVW